jgi:hypothetical protein
MKLKVIVSVLLLLSLILVSCGGLAETEPPSVADDPKEKESENHTDEHEDLSYPEESDDLSSADENSDFSRPEEYGEGIYECLRHQFNSYHTFGAPLINYVGSKELSEWSNTTRELHGHCGINVVQLIRDFDIPREDLEVLMDTTLFYYAGHDLDVIYSGDDELIELYYTTAS